MTNTATINISSPDGSHKIFVQQDANNKRTINSSIEGSNSIAGKEHILYECSANSDGTSLSFTTDIHLPFWVFYGDKGTLSVDVANGAVALDIDKANVHYSGVVGPGEAAAVVAFVKACGLPSLGS